MSKRRSKDWYRARDEHEQMLCLAGVPSRYWHINPANLKLSQIIYERFDKNVKTISANSQQQWFEKLLKDPIIFTHPFLVGIGSKPTDDLALAAAYSLLSVALKRKLRVKAINVGSPDLETNDQDVLVFHNILHNCSIEQAEKARNLITQFDDRFRIVVVAGNHPIELFYTKLAVPPNILFNLEGTLTTTLLAM